VLKYDFKAALAKIKGLRDINMAEDLRPRIERRILELERCARFKDSLIAAIKSKGSQPSKFKLEIDPQSFGGLEGTIEDADDRTLQIRLSAGGVKYHGWTEFDPLQFHKFVIDQWKYSKEQRRDITDQNDLAAVCMEFGLYEKALEAIQVSYDLMQDPVAQIPPAAKAFVEEYPDRIRRGESAEFSEIEAKKRIARLKDFMTQMKYPAAKAELDILHIHYWKTNEVQGQQQQLQDLEKKISKEGGESLNTAVKADRLKALLAKVAEEQMNARKAQGDIVSRIGRMEDPFEKNLPPRGGLRRLGGLPDLDREVPRGEQGRRRDDRGGADVERVHADARGGVRRDVPQRGAPEGQEDGGVDPEPGIAAVRQPGHEGRGGVVVADGPQPGELERELVSAAGEERRPPAGGAEEEPRGSRADLGAGPDVLRRRVQPDGGAGATTRGSRRTIRSSRRFRTAPASTSWRSSTTRPARCARRGSSTRTSNACTAIHPMVSDNGSRGVRRRIDECFKIATRMNYTEKPK
jgi:hypothetical protein